MSCLIGQWSVLSVLLRLLLWICCRCTNTVVCWETVGEVLHSLWWMTLWQKHTVVCSSVSYSQATVLTLFTPLPRLSLGLFYKSSLHRQTGFKPRTHHHIMSWWTARLMPNWKHFPAKGSSVLRKGCFPSLTFSNSEPDRFRIICVFSV